jgi:hypothetical protein
MRLDIAKPVIFISSIFRVCVEYVKRMLQRQPGLKKLAASESVADSQRRDAEVIALDGSEW